MKARSMLLQVAVAYLMPLLLIFSIFLLIRGHNEVGGGFVGGLVAAAAFILHAIAESPKATRAHLPLSPDKLIAVGLSIALLSGVLALFQGNPFMTGIWLKQPLPVIGKVGTPFIFDVGVYLVVIGVCLHILLNLAEDER
ncbi:MULTISPECIES: Na+/H+ antiporter subunit B [Anaerolinea]|uniref:Na+/H+ antiporter subunit B n=1 Tax=Anaerolinea TaxID=233189 RepID=UPI002607CC98|nr:Na+/H+ antiporter subunit B [Anaerolinea thermophila]